MKKFFMYAMAAVAMLSVSSCLSEEDVNLTLEQSGSISVQISADKSLVTRASTGVSDPTKWFAFIDGDGTANDFGTDETHKIMTTLATTKFLYGTYNVTVSNYANMAAAHEANSNLGAAYYEGTENNVTVNANAATNVTINCGKAQNAKFDVTQTGFNGTTTTGLYFTNVDITSNSTETGRITGEGGSKFSALTTATSAFFKATTTLGYRINWKKDGTDKHFDGEITLSGAGTQNYLSLVINSDGTITIANTTGITYDNEWNTGTTSTITVNAETGNKI